MLDQGGQRRRQVLLMSQLGVMNRLGEDEVDPLVLHRFGKFRVMQGNQDERPAGLRAVEVIDQRLPACRGFSDRPVSQYAKAGRRLRSGVVPCCTAHAHAQEDCRNDA
ncbi:hypothetical protein SDC9_194955 [bioreactor metagenome]|uniref:Uncharacterized protein n=1 Tax=bioreactor metagenome TaxID=1076179 RepID=A0A645IJ42_9ZZZZ